MKTVEGRVVAHDAMMKTDASWMTVQAEVVATIDAVGVVVAIGGTTRTPSGTMTSRRSEDKISAAFRTRTIRRTGGPAMMLPRLRAGTGEDATTSSPHPVQRAADPRRTVTAEVPRPSSGKNPTSKRTGAV